MRVAAIVGIGTSPKQVQRFRADAASEWFEGLPSSRDEADAIALFGGDGTIHRHLAPLVRLGLPVLIVPTGSGNDFARALELRSAKEARNLWGKFEGGAARIREIDLGVIRSDADPERRHYFCCVAGCGLDASVARRANGMPRWLRSHGGYTLSLMPTIFSYPPFSMRLTEFSGQGSSSREGLTLLAAFANTQFYGGGMRIAPHADPSDGKLDLCRVEAMDPFRLFCLFPSVYFGRHLGIKQVEYSQADRVRVETGVPLEIFADGEYVCETPVEIGTERGALRVISG